jgi:hypothetical protein
MLSLGIEKQRKRPPFFKYERGAGGRRSQTCQTKVFYSIVYFTFPNNFD